MRDWNTTTRARLIYWLGYLPAIGILIAIPGVQSVWAVLIVCIPFSILSMMIRDLYERLVRLEQRDAVRAAFRVGPSDG